MKTILTTIAFLLLTTPLFAQVRLTGQVTDPDGKPVTGAEVKLTSERVPEMQPMRTDKRGRWAALLPVGGPWNIDISKEGFLTFRGSVNVSEAGRMPPLNSTMEPRPQAAPAPAEEPPTPEPSVSPEAVAAVQAGERLLRRAAGTATPEDLEALGLTPDAGPPTPEELAELHRAAVVEFRKAHELIPDHVEIMKALARSHYAVGELDAAVALLEDVLEVEPSNVGIAMLMVNLLAEQGNLERAREVVDALPAGALHEPTAFLNVAILFLNQGNANEAHRYADRAVSIDPTKGEPYYYRGIASLQMEKMNEARADFEKVVQLAPESPEASDAKALLDQMN
ncbi:MAG: tetratricopeptide repeat protein [Acidobacteria bacterium]|nr:tetratricopeptide repeat protein [Acidobacteriota bacterium]